MSKTVVTTNVVKNIAEAEKYIAKAGENAVEAAKETMEAGKGAYHLVNGTGTAAVETAKVVYNVAATAVEVAEAGGYLVRDLYKGAANPTENAIKHVTHAKEYVNATGTDFVKGLEGVVEGGKGAAHLAIHGFNATTNAVEAVIKAVEAGTHTGAAAVEVIHNVWDEIVGHNHVADMITEVAVTLEGDDHFHTLPLNETGEA